MNLAQGLEKLKEGEYVYDTKFRYVFFFEDITNPFSELMFYKSSNPNEIKKVSLDKLRIEQLLDDRFEIYEEGSITSEERDVVEKLLSIQRQEGKIIGVRKTPTSDIMNDKGNDTFLLELITVTEQGNDKFTILQEFNKDEYFTSLEFNQLYSLPSLGILR